MAVERAAAWAGRGRSEWRVSGDQRNLIEIEPFRQRAANSSAIAYATWGLCLVSHVATILYAIVCMADLIMAAIFFGNALACLGIILIATRNRHHFHLRNAQTL